MPGYSFLASLMVSRSDTQIFRSFKALNLETLLHKQAELQGLELAIDEIRQDSDLNGFDRSWLDAPSSDANAIIGNIFERARTALDTYYKTLLLTAQVESLSSVPDDQWELLKRWYDEEKGGNNWLHGPEATMFRDESCRSDLLSLNGNRGREDPIAVFIADKVLPIYDRAIGHRLHRSMPSEAFADAREYHMKTMVILASALCMLASAALPSVSILVLSNLTSLNGRLVTIVVLSLVFAIVMGLVTQRKADVFISVTAFAAILAVFVTQPQGN